MLTKNGDIWKASDDLQIEKTRIVVPFKTPFGEVNTTTVGSKVTMHDDITVIHRNPDLDPMKEASLVEILKLHKTQCDLFAFFRPGMSNGIPMALASLLIKLGEHDGESIVDWTPIVFTTGEWEHKHDGVVITLERRCVHGGWFTRYTLTETLKISEFPNAVPYKTSRTETITLRDEVPVPVTPEHVIKMFFVTDPEMI